MKNKLEVVKNLINVGKKTTIEKKSIKVGLYLTFRDTTKSIVILEKSFYSLRNAYGVL